LIESLLTLSRVTSRAQPLQAVDLNEVVGDVLSDLQVRREQSRGRVKADQLPTLTADPSQMRELFQNLIDNSLKFHKQDVPPLVHIYGRRKAKAGEIHVTDNGIECEEQYLTRIFRPLQRLHRRNEFEGTGMGLTICSKIIVRHAGEITARSEPGAGSDFVVTRPTSALAKEAEAS
jgi:light-regulated signal transduction histidine kinase (bacteriophytochrome)